MRGGSFCVRRGKRERTGAQQAQKIGKASHVVPCQMTLPPPPVLPRSSAASATGCPRSATAVAVGEAI